MACHYPQTGPILIEQLTAHNFLAYGCLLGELLGKTALLDDNIPAFSNTETNFWEEHIYSPGAGGETQLLTVNYRNKKRDVSGLEVHRLCEQAIIPLTGEIIQVVANSGIDGSPAGDSMKAFRVPVGMGICMRPGCWHTTRVEVQEVRCLMLTRRSTTLDLIAHLTGGSRLSESAISVIKPRRLAP